MDWKAQVTVPLGTNYCPNMSTQFKFVCIVIDNLSANTTYAFQVQAFNEGEPKGSAFSETFIATTDPVVKNVTHDRKPETITPSLQASNENEGYDTVSSHLILIIVSLVIIVILIIVVVSLVYKIKMFKLKQKYEARQRQLSVHYNTSVIGSPQSLNVSALGNYFPSTTTIEYNVAHYVRDIQNRRLPDLPDPEHQIPVETPYENTDQSPDLIANVNTRKVSGKSPKITISPSLFSHLKPEPECTDTDGYLRPTFPVNPDFRARPMTSEESVRAEEHATVIATESYVSAVQLEAVAASTASISATITASTRQRPQPTIRTISPIMTAESHPLISLSSTTSSRPEIL